MHDFHYNIIKKRFGKNVKLLFMDADSIIYHFKACDPYEFMKNNLDSFLLLRRQ